jgi:2,4-dienoyl-CoA reductase-like NADH-dependent reductase (Old Yellow Enzyme family)
MSGLVYVEGGVKAQYSQPRALETEEVSLLVQEFTDAAVAAVEVSLSA